MATTGFWPVKNRLKEVIDYAENPDKTIDKKYVAAICTPPYSMSQTIKRQIRKCMCRVSTATPSELMSV